MAANLQQAKAALRREVRKRLQAVPPDRRACLSREICDLIRAQPIWSAAKSILLFAPLTDEPALRPLLHEALATDKEVALPRFVSIEEGYTACRIRDPDRDLLTAKFDILEPLPSCPEIPMDRVDLVLVPGVAFDLHGRRLGRGKGYYDRLLRGVRGTKCGVAFDEQVVGEVPSGPLDMRVDCLLTPTRWVAVPADSRRSQGK